MVNLYNSWATITSALAQFTWFILGYALAKLGFMKTLGLFLIFFAAHWLWNHQAAVTKIINVTVGEG